MRDFSGAWYKKVMKQEETANLTIRLFGSLRLVCNGQELSLRSRKAGSLLALLVLRADGEVQREWLAETLWPDDEIENRQASLRQRLADLRKILGSQKERLQSPTSRTLRFDVTGIEIDVLEFDRAIAKADIESLKTAVALYTGPLLEDSAELWVLGEREHRQQSYLKALESLAQDALAAGSARDAIDFLQRGVRVDLWHQSMHRSLIQVQARQGDLDAALRVYAELAEALRRQHNAVPEVETQRLYQELRTKARSLPTRSRVQGTTKQDDGKGSLLRTDDAARNPGVGGRAATKPICHVPVPLTALIGRERELREIQARLLTARLLTLAGIGGSGKTRLAIEAGRELCSAFPDGVYFADLSGISDPEQVPQSVAAALKMPAMRGHTWLQALQDYLHSRHVLLILDNCEHLQEACLELVQSLLQSCMFLRVLATSRQAFRLTGECALPIAPLPLPESESVSPDELMRFDSVRFFLERARAARSDFGITQQNAPDVARLCRMLDGLPLALELAAGLMAVLSIEEIQDYLEAHRLAIENMDSTVPDRHRSLQAMLEWSYRLLQPAEQRCFARLSVFAGGFTRHAVEEICCDALAMPPATFPSQERESPPGGKKDGESALKMLAGLVSKSLIVVDQREGRTRYRLLETVRAFATEQLEASGERALMTKRLLQFCFEMARSAEPGLTGPEQAAWIDRLEQEHVNLRAALRIYDTPEMALTALRLATLLGRFWQVRGYFAEGRETLAGLLAATEADPDTRERADAMNWAGILAVYQSDYEAAHHFCRKAREIWEALDDMQGLGGALGGLGMIAKDTGDLPGARRLFEESLRSSRQAGDRLGEAGSLGYLGIVAASLGETDTARACYEASLALRRTMQDHWGIAASLNNLALLARECGDNEEAKRLIEESIAIRRHLQDRRSLAISLNVLGELLCELGDFSTARLLFLESLALCRELGDRRSIAFSLEHFALLADLTGQAEQSARLYGAADSLRDRIKAPHSPGNRARWECAIEKLKGALGEDTFHAAYKSGQNADLELLLEEIGGKS